MTAHRHLFPAPAVTGYLNGASRSPQLRSVAAAARNALKWREEHPGMPIANFFGDVVTIKSLFAKLINCPDPQRIALTPAASYGIATVAKNLPLADHQNIIVAEDQFPSNYYSWDVLCKERGAELRLVKRPVKGNWSDRVLEAIDERTAAVAIAQLHWVDGTMFDLRAIRGRTNEENWIKRAGSEDFRKLVNYRDDYRPLAGRYSVGEHSNFLMAPMQVAALKQVNDWTPELVQTYCKGLWDSTGSVFDRAGIEIPGDRAYHLIGLTLPGHIDQEKLSAEIERRGLTVSYRGDAVRVSPNVYNTEEELVSLGEALLASVI